MNAAEEQVRLWSFDSTTGSREVSKAVKQELQEVNWEADQTQELLYETYKNLSYTRLADLPPKWRRRSGGDTATAGP